MQVHIHTYAYPHVCVQGHKYTQPRRVVGWSVAAHRQAEPGHTQGPSPGGHWNSTAHTGPFVCLLELSSPSPAYFLLEAVGDTVPGQHRATTSSGQRGLSCCHFTTSSHPEHGLSWSFSGPVGTKRLSTGAEGHS